MIAKSKTKSPPDVAKLTKAQAKVEHMRLALELEGHDKRYYQEDAPSVTDAEYDALRHRGASRKCGTRCRCCRSTTRSPNRTCLTSSAVSSAFSSSVTTRSIFRPSRRSTG